MPSAAPVPSRGMAVARRTATPASGAVRSARGRHFFFNDFKDRSLFLYLPRVSFSFLFSNFHHELILVLIVAKNETQGKNRMGFLLVGYWVDSSPACFAICANSWCRRMLFLFVKPCKLFLLQRERGVKHARSMYFSTFPPVYTSKSTRKRK